MEIIFQKQWDYIFSKNENNEFLLSVLCGSVGLFEIDIILNPEEVSQYNMEGEKFIDDLAKKIKYSPSDWTARNIN